MDTNAHSNSLGATWIGNNYYSKFLFQNTFSAYNGPDTNTLPLQGGTLYATGETYRHQLQSLVD